jgi:hypothetical protein
VYRLRTSAPIELVVVAAIIGILLVLMIAASRQNRAANGTSIADAGTEPVRLDGIGSYDLSQTGPLGYTWTKISGSSVTVTTDGFCPQNAVYAR